MSSGINYELFAQAESSPAGETHAETSAESGHGDPKLMTFDPGVGIWSIVVFVVLLLILKKMAWGPILASVDEREKRIKDSLDKANQIQIESKRIGEEQNKILTEARAEASALLQNTRQASEELRKKLEEAAHAEKSRILESAKREIDIAKSAALSELKKTTADLAIQVAEKLLQQSLDDAKHRQVVDQLINELSVKDKA